MDPIHEQAFLEFCRIEREALRAVEEKIRARQLGEAFEDLESEMEDVKEAA